MIPTQAREQLDKHTRAIVQGHFSPDTVEGKWFPGRDTYVGTNT